MELRKIGAVRGGEVFDGGRFTARDVYLAGGLTVAEEAQADGEELDASGWPASHGRL